MANYNVKKTIERMISAYKFKNQIELTNHLDIANTATTGWKNRQAVPEKHLQKCSNETGVSVQELMFGKSEVKLSKAEFRFVFERVLSNAIQSKILDRGEDFTPEQVMTISDRLYDSISKSNEELLFSDISRAD